MTPARADFDEDEELLDAEDLIEEDTCEGDDADEEAKVEHYRKNLADAQRDKRLRARSAPSIGSPSSANQRKRSAERVTARTIEFEFTSPREEYEPPPERPPSRLQHESSNPGEESMPWTSDSRSPLATVDENNAAAFGSQPGSERGSPAEPPQSSPAATDATGPPAKQDPFEFAMSLLEQDLEASDHYFRAPVSKVPAADLTKAHRQQQADGQARNHGASALGQQGLLGLTTKTRKDRTAGAASRSRASVALADPRLLPATAPLSGYHTAEWDKALAGLRPSHSLPGRPGTAPSRQHAAGSPGSATKQRSSSARPPGDQDKPKESPHITMVKQKIKDANALNRYLNLQSRYRYTTLRDCLSPAIQVTMTAEGQKSRRTISLQSFLNTYSRLQKLRAMGERARQPTKDGSMADAPPSPPRSPRSNRPPGLVLPSPGARNQAELVTALHDTVSLCDVLSEQVALLRATQPTAHRISDHLSFAGV
eukprot:jgi/Tetstr1/458059/TSEL_044566.t1